MTPDTNSEQQRVARRGGRPALEEGSVAEAVCVRMPPSLHDRACRVALRTGESVSAIIRLALARYLDS